MGNTIWDDIKLKFRSGDTVIKLIMINIAVYLVVNLLVVPIFLLGFSTDTYEYLVREWFYFPSELAQIPVRIWTLLTYMFFHASFMHILFNMLCLYWFGNILSNLVAHRKIAAIYLLGGFAGALIFALAFNSFPIFTQMPTKPPLLGASAGVFAVIFATTTLTPRGVIRLLFIGNVELRYIAFFLIIFNIIPITGSNPGGSIAHLGGALMGWLYVIQLRKGIDWAAPFEKIWNFFTRKSHQKEPSMPHYANSHSKSNYRTPRMSVHKGGQHSDIYTQEYSRSFIQKYQHLSKEECIDAILDKIRNSGYDSLSEDEKAFLDKTSRE